MRRWLCIGIAYVVLGGIGIGWYLLGSKLTTESFVPQTSSSETATRSAPSQTQEGDGEASDAIEPLVVENSTPAQLQQADWGAEEAPLSRVVLARGMQQPPRPDAQPGQAPRMPYADECEIRETPLDVLMRIVRSHLAQWNLFVENGQPEDAGTENVTPATEPTPQPMPESMPMTDYHHQYPHCPYHGGCPYPYRR